MSAWRYMDKAARREAVRYRHAVLGELAPDIAAALGAPLDAVEEVFEHEPMTTGDGERADCYAPASEAAPRVLEAGGPIDASRPDHRAVPGGGEGSSGPGRAVPAAPKRVGMRATPRAPLPSSSIPDVKVAGRPNETPLMIFLPPDIAVKLRDRAKKVGMRRAEAVVFLLRSVLGGK